MQIRVLLFYWTAENSVMCKEGGSAAVPVHYPSGAVETGRE